MCGGNMELWDSQICECKDCGNMFPEEVLEWKRVGMNELITTVRSTTRLYKQPKRIGDVIDVKDKDYLIIGIQDIRVLYGKTLEIFYMCQSLDVEHVFQPEMVVSHNNFVELELVIPTGKEKEYLKRIELGRMVLSEGRPYQTIEYTDVELKFTDVVISFLARPIKPVSQKEEKAKLLNEKKKRLSLSVF